VAIGVSAVVFSVVHGQLDGVALIPLALLLGCLYDRQHRFLPVFVAHAFFNLTNIVLALVAP
jgi:membrane protease YdiL (CAAX protease family)